MQNHLLPALSCDAASVALCCCLRKRTDDFPALTAEKQTHVFFCRLAKSSHGARNLLSSSAFGNVKAEKAFVTGETAENELSLLLNRLFNVFSTRTCEKPVSNVLRTRLD